jgi:hypothetical protein
MITVDRLKTLTSFTPVALSQSLSQSGYKGAKFMSAKFVGISNGGEFCYSVVYDDEDGLGPLNGKIYLSYDHANDSVTAGY